MPDVPEKFPLQENSLRVALVAGELSQGGAEKQLVYITHALHKAGVCVKIISLTQGDYYEERLAALGLPPVWIGMHSNPLARIVSLVRAVRNFRPHILQSAHYFTNFHTAIAARLLGKPGTPAPLSIGCIRSDPHRFRSGYGGKFVNTFARNTTQRVFWSQSLLHLPSALIANSSTAREHAIQIGISPQKVYVLSNVIDLEDFDSARRHPSVEPLVDFRQGVMAVAVSRLIPVKRLELFMKALAVARQEAPELRGVLIGEGSERGSLESLAADLGLFSREVMDRAIGFLGHQQNIPSILSHADMLILTSEYEGFPNVLLEAMAARLPVITTPAGDAGLVVQDGITGYVIPHGDIEGLAGRMVLLAKSPDLRRQLGEAGRRRVEHIYSSDSLATRLLSIYQEIAQARGNHRLLELLAASYAPV